MLIELLFILIIFIIIPLIFIFKILPHKQIPLIVALGVVVGILFSFWKGWSFFDLGIRLDNLSVSILPYVLFTLVFLIILIVYSKNLHKRGFVRKNMISYFEGLIFIPSSFAQAFLFRSILILLLLELVGNLWLVILINTILYTFVHIVYKSPRPFFTLLLTFIWGAGFAWIYLTYPNLILISISHSILNFTALYHGFFCTERPRKR